MLLILTSLISLQGLSFEKVAAPTGLGKIHLQPIYCAADLSFHQ